MNPPFTTPTNHAADHARPGNPAFAAFNTTQAEQKAMSDKVKRLSIGTISDGNAGLGTQFAAIANNMVKPGGHIALILPLSAMLGGSDSPSARSWLKLRGLLAEKFNDIVVVSIAQNKDIDSSFSADTDMAEVIVVARSLRDGERPKHLAYFVNLSERPADKLAAQETAKSIRKRWPDWPDRERTPTLQWRRFNRQRQAGKGQPVREMDNCPYCKYGPGPSRRRTGPRETIAAPAQRPSVYPDDPNGEDWQSGAPT